MFSVDRDTGVVHLRQELDREKQDTIEVIISMTGVWCATDTSHRNEWLCVIGEILRKNLSEFFLAQKYYIVAFINEVCHTNCNRNVL